MTDIDTYRKSKGTKGNYTYLNINDSVYADPPEASLSFTGEYVGTYSTPQELLKIIQGIVGKYTTLSQTLVNFKDVRDDNDPEHYTFDFTTRATTRATTGGRNFVLWRIYAHDRIEADQILNLVNNYFSQLGITNSRYN